MGAAAFYDLDGTLVRTNLVHAFAFSARNQQGLLKSIVKTAATLISVPMFLAADFYNRRLFNDLFFVRYRGESEDRLRCLAAGAVRHRVAAFDLPRRLRADRQIASARAAPGAGDGRAGHHRGTARQAPEDRRLCDESLGVRRRLCDRAPAAPRDGRSDQGELDANLRREGKPEPVRLLRLQRQHERPADAVGRRPPDRRQPRHPPAQHGAAARLADPGSAMVHARTSAQGSSRSGAAEQGRRSGRLHRRRLRAAHPVLGRGSAARGPADRHARPLPEAAHRGPGQPGRRDPLRAEPPAGGGPAVRAARARHARDDRRRRHQPAAAADDDARHPADDHRDPAGAAGRERRRRRAHRHRQLAAPAPERPPR